nr:PAS domain-containing protein [Amycolatopsis sp. FDAARGOS 1241]
MNQQAEVALGLSERDIGRPLRLERRSLRIKDVEWHRGGETVWYEVHVNPLLTKEKDLLGVSVVFHDVSWARQLLTELEHTNRQLESAYEELQSTIEELETTNEELQSTVEELETMNEELQSTNDELQTINDALRERSLDLDEVNEFLESVLTSIRAGIVVIDTEMQIKAWNRGAEDVWGLRREGAEGSHLLNIDIGLPLADLRPAVREALTDPGFHTELMLNAINRRGRKAVVPAAVQRAAELGRAEPGRAAGDGGSGAELGGVSSGCLARIVAAPVAHATDSCA